MTKSKKAVAAAPKTTKSETSKNANLGVEDISFVIEEQALPAEIQVPDKTQQIKEILSKVEKLENLKNYYGKMKVKKNDLEDAFEKMTLYKNEPSDQFEEGNRQEFPYQIVLVTNTEYNRQDKIFKISQPDTVTRFTEFLLKNVDEILEAFEKDLLEESKKGTL